VPTDVAEQRVTNFGIHVFIGLSLLLAPWLKYLPKAVLYGVFLYMGVSSLNGNELFERLVLWAIWDTRKYPHYPYLLRVSIKRVHIFTALQAFGLAVLYALKSIKQVAVVFPFFIAFLACVRPCFGKYFTKDELEALDGDEAEESAAPECKDKQPAIHNGDDDSVLAEARSACDDLEQIVRTVSGNVVRSISGDVSMAARIKEGSAESTASLSV